MTDFGAASLAGAVIGLALGFIFALSMAIGQGKWRGFVPRLLGAGVGGLAGGSLGGLLQAGILPEPFFFGAILNLGTIMVVAASGSLLGLWITGRIFRARRA
jgi:hypothetical protein